MGLWRGSVGNPVVLWICRGFVSSEALGREGNVGGFCNSIDFVKQAGRGLK